MSIIVVGAGLCGLSLADQIQTAGLGPVRILEKSRSVGGRMATRRTDTCRFDHGAQFYAHKEPINSLHQKWLNENVSSFWHKVNGSSRYRSLEGMTALAKKLATSLDIQLEKKVARLKPEEGGWRVLLEDGSEIPAQTVILTCPLPQALTILEHSHIAFDTHLTSITYAKALVGLFEQVSGADPFSGPNGYIENPNSDIFSITDQYLKGVSAASAWTVTMNPVFSEKHFDSPDDEIMSKIEASIRGLSPQFSFETAQLKKWRYSHPLQTHSSPYEVVAPGVIVAGDAFTSPSLNGAARSATAVFNYLKANAR